jgi:hypothetical protein
MIDYRVLVLPKTDSTTMNPNSRRQVVLSSEALETNDCTRNLCILLKDQQGQTNEQLSAGCMSKYIHVYIMYVRYM